MKALKAIRIKIQIRDVCKILEYKNNSHKDTKNKNRITNYQCRLF